MSARRLLCTALGVTLLALVVPGVPARAATVSGSASRVQVLEQGALRAGGAGGVIAVRLTCPEPREDYPLYAHVRQRAVSGRVAHFGGWRHSATCGPAGRRVLIPVFGPNNKAGDALQPGRVSVELIVGRCGEGDGCRVEHGEQHLTARDDLDRPTLRLQGTTVHLPAGAGLLAGGAAARTRLVHRCGGPDSVNDVTFLYSQQARQEPFVHWAEAYHEAPECDGGRHVSRSVAVPSHAAFTSGRAFAVATMWTTVRLGDHYLTMPERVWREVTLEARDRA